MTLRTPKRTKEKQKMFIIYSTRPSSFKISHKKKLFYIQPKGIKHKITKSITQKSSQLLNTAIPKVDYSTIQDNKIKKRIKIKFTVCRPTPKAEKKIKKIKETKFKNKKLSLHCINNANKENNYEIGRWKYEEHQRFVQAIIKYGNDWKQVQKCVKTRSSTQARSHAQKFFIKIKKAKVLSFNLDLSKSSIKMFHDYIDGKSKEEYEKIVQELNDIHSERKGNSLSKRRNSLSKSMINSYSTDVDILGVSKLSRQDSVDDMQERRRERNSINSIEGFFNYNENLFLEKNGEKPLIYEGENLTTLAINEKEYANSFNLAFRNNNGLYENEEMNQRTHLTQRNGNVSQEDDFLFNYIKQ